MKNVEKNENVTGAEMRMVAIDEICVVHNPRKRFDGEKMEKLKNSIALHGVQQPLLLRYADAVGMEYELVAGERRLRASKLAGLEEVPCVIRELTERQARELALVENLDREDLDVLEEADGYHGLLELGYNVSELALRFNISRDYITSRLELRKLGEKECEALRDRNVTLKTAVALGKISDEERRGKALEQILHPKFEEGALKQDAALRLIRNDFLEPQEEAEKWADRKNGLLQEHPDHEWMDFEQSAEAKFYSSPYALADDKLPSWELSDRVRGENAEEVPTWGEVAKQYGAKLYLAYSQGGEGYRMYVDSEAIKEGDLANPDVKKSWFMRPKTKDEKEQESLEKERERELLEVAKGEYCEQRDAFFRDLLKMMKGQNMVFPEMVKRLARHWVNEHDLWGTVEFMAGVECPEEMEWEESRRHLETMLDEQLEKNPERVVVWMLIYEQYSYSSYGWNSEELAALVKESPVQAENYPRLVETLDEEEAEDEELPVTSSQFPACPEPENPACECPACVDAQVEDAEEGGEV